MVPELGSDAVTVLQAISTILGFIIVGLLGVIAYRAIKNKL